MARIRTIKPEFPQSETIGALSRDARLLFIQLWTIVDDEGRARAASRMLASLLYPYDDDAKDLIEGWLTELEKNNCIRRYVADGSTYLEVTNWLTHQKIDHPAKSRLPPFSDDLAKPREPSRKLAPDLGPRTLDLGPGTLDQETRASALWPPDYREQFWSKYPNKVGKPDALKKLDRVRSSGKVPWEVLWGGLERYVSKTDDRPWCNPATWINQQRWDDQPGESNGRRPEADRSAFAGAGRLLEKIRQLNAPVAENRPGGSGEPGANVVRLLPQG